MCRLTLPITRPTRAGKARLWRAVFIGGLGLMRHLDRPWVQTRNKERQCYRDGERYQ